MLICEALAFFLSFFFFFQKLLTLRKWNLWFRGPSSEGVERDRKKKQHTKNQPNSSTIAP